ncbi:hypothetical protein FALCPG4_016030 [Fusarium falciforme]
MALSDEAIIAIVGVVMGIPTAAMFLLGLWRKLKSGAPNPSTSDDPESMPLTRRTPTRTDVLPTEIRFVFAPRDST